MPSSPSSSRKKKKHKGALARLKDKYPHNDGSQSSLRSQEMLDLRQIDKMEDAERNAGIVNRADDLLSQLKSQNMSVPQVGPEGDNSVFSSKQVVNGTGSQAMNKNKLAAGTESNKAKTDYGLTSLGKCVEAMFKLIFYHLVFTY